MALKKSDKKSKESKNNPKYIFVVGGVISGVGKGVAASSIGKILQDRDLKVTAIKIDPYINIDAGTMNPTEHGEVYVTDDGDECDQDMGNYERFLGITLSRDNYMTTGRVYQSVIEKERNLEYGGKCVEVVPHVPLEIIERIKKAQKNAKADVVIIEIGGTVGEYQNILFLEAARMMKIKHPGDVLFVMVSYLPVPSKVGEMKTKPTQYAVRTLNASGIQPDIIVARAEKPLDEKRKQKLAMFCNVPANHIVSAPDIESIYDVPVNFEKEKLSELICEFLGATCKPQNKKSAGEWKKFVSRVHHSKDTVNIAMVGKYFETGDYVLSDSYLSVIEAIKYSAYSQNKKPVLTWISSIDFETKKRKISELSNYDGIIVPGGFGTRGVEGIISTIKYARENGIPYFGLCYGMQLMVIEYARNVLKLRDAHTLEVNPKSKSLVINIMETQKSLVATHKMGGTMRLGAYDTDIAEGTHAFAAYKSKKISERHRHRYEVNGDYIKKFEESGLVFSGKSQRGELMEIAELPKKIHPFMLGTQFHPEYKARPLAPHPLFTAFIKSIVDKKNKK